MPPPRESREDKKRAIQPPPRLAAEQKPRRTTATEFLAQKAPLPPPLEFPLQRTAARELASRLAAAWETAPHPAVASAFCPQAALLKPPLESRNLMAEPNLTKTARTAPRKSPRHQAAEQEAPRPGLPLELSAAQKPRPRAAMMRPPCHQSAAPDFSPSRWPPEPHPALNPATLPWPESISREPSSLCSGRKP
jgi:hypothetical protein